jgi:hypothetical protein
VRAVSGVTSLTFRQNVTGAPALIDGINLVAHSVYACVNGGSDSAVALALLESKSDGADWNGGLAVPTIDPESGQPYDVKFDRPDIKDMEIEVTVKSGSAVVDPIQAVKDAIVAYANGLIEGEDGFVVGNDVSPFELSGAINVQYPSLFVTEVKVDESGGTPVVAVFPIGLDEIAAVIEADISVTVSA